MPSDENNLAWWLQPPLLQNELLVALKQGLSTAEAKSRLATFGLNVLQERQRKSLLNRPGFSRHLVAG